MRHFSLLSFHAFVTALFLCTIGLVQAQNGNPMAEALADMDLDTLLLEVLPEEGDGEADTGNAVDANGEQEAEEAAADTPQADGPAEDDVVAPPETSETVAGEEESPDEGVEILLGEMEGATDAEADEDEAVPMTESEESLTSPETEPAPEMDEPATPPVPEVAPAEEERVESDREADAARAEAENNEILISELATLEVLRRKALEEHGKSSLRQAEEAMRAGRFEEAQQRFEEALRYIPDRKENAGLIGRAQTGIAESLYRDALLLQRRGQFDEALEVAGKALDEGHPKGAELVAEIEKQIEQPPKPEEKTIDRRWDEPAFKADLDTIENRLSRARQFYLTTEYAKAKSEVDQILRDYPFNRDAIDLLEKIAERTYDVSSEEFQATRTKMIRDVRNAWNPRVYAIDQIDMGAAARADDYTTEITQQIQSEEARIRNKLGKIIIPEINFRNANIYDVIEFLNTASQEFDDPEVPRRDRGVNFILQLPRSAASQPAARRERDPFAMDEVTEAVAGGVPPISFTARFLPLSDVLRVIMEVGGLKYRVKNNVVMIMPLDVPDADIVHRMYDVLPTLSERVLSASREISEDRGGGGRAQDPFGRMEAVERGSAGADDWKQFFNELGVGWPAGSAISYMGSIGKLKVANTPENLAELESILGALNVTPRQIEIEARFVEVSQTDLESLGFEWLINGDWNLMEHKDDAGLPLEARRRINVSTSSDGGLTSGNRYLTAGVGGSGLSVADDILHVASVLTNPELSFILHALSQRQNTDLLSAPKVVTKSGYEATMKVVTEYIYPTEFRVEIIESSVSSGSSTVDSPIAGLVEPGGFQMREVGVILQVMAEVSTEGQMINLLMTPQVVSEPEWKNYGTRYVDPESGTIVELPMEQPFFSLRSVNTSISIYNGATVVLGGMITEVRTEVDDKIPILGDIPGIGRLFRSRYERSDKRNLLIFVTARLVDPAGRVVRLMDDSLTFGEGSGRQPRPGGSDVLLEAPEAMEPGGGMSAF